MLSILLSIAAIVITWYFLKTHYYGYWKKRGVPGPEPVLFFGNVADNFLLRRSFGEIMKDVYRKYENTPIVGFYRTITPALILRDPEVIKDVVVKSFSSFHDNDIDVDIKIDPILGRNPFTLKGEKWKTTRTQVTPCFTSGKMKSLLPTLDSIGEEFVVFIAKQPDAFNKKGLEAKELCTKLTLNNVASCAFGLEGKCFEDENAYFRQLANRFLKPSSWVSFKIFLGLILPSVTKFFEMKFISKDVEDELFQLVKKTLKYRKENNVNRNDFLHFMAQLKESPTEDILEDIDIVAQCATFFGDGYETSSSVMSFVLYNLASNPQTQHRLRDEIKEYLGEPGQNLSYEKLHEMPYLDAVINESLRITPSVYVLSKRCTKPYTFAPKNNSDVIKNSVTIEAGTPIFIPLEALQHDSKYFEEPDSFKPERFLGDNGKNIPKYAFMPFGEGPRACVGKRFGVLQIKVGIVHLIRSYEISVNKKTKIPFEYDKMYILNAPVGGIWLDFKSIDK